MKRKEFGLPEEQKNNKKNKLDQELPKNNDPLLPIPRFSFFSNLSIDLILQIFIFLPVRSNYLRILHNIFGENPQTRDKNLSRYWEYRLGTELKILNKILRLQNLKKKERSLKPDKELEVKEQLKLESFLKIFPPSRYFNLDNYKAIYKQKIMDDSVIPLNQPTFSELSLTQEQKIKLANNFSKIFLSSILQKYKIFENFLLKDETQKTDKTKTVIISTIFTVKNKNGFTLFELLCKYQLNDLLNILYTQFIKPRTNEKLFFHDQHLLIWAIFCNQPLSEIQAICEKILITSSNANTNNTTIDSALIIKIITTVFLDTIAFYQAIYYGRKDILFYFIKTHKLPLNYISPPLCLSGRHAENLTRKRTSISPVIMAVKYKKIDIAEFLIEENFNLDFTAQISENHSEENALNLARRKKLMRNGSNDRKIELKNIIINKIKNEQKDITPFLLCDLERAIGRRDLILLKQLIDQEGANVKAILSTGNSLLQEACYFHYNFPFNLELIEYLTDKGADIHYKNSDHGMTALHILLLNNSAEIDFDKKISLNQLWSKMPSSDDLDRVRILVLLLKKGINFKARYDEYTARKLAEEHKFTVSTQWLTNAEIFTASDNNLYPADPISGLQNLEKFYISEALPFTQKQAKEFFKELFKIIIPTESVTTANINSFKEINIQFPIELNNIPGLYQATCSLLDFLQTFPTPKTQYNLVVQMGQFGRRPNFFAPSPSSTNKNQNENEKSEESKESKKNEVSSDSLSNLNP